MTNAGVIAIGDSIANGHGDMINGVQSQSWALWVADAAGWGFRRISVGGAESGRVIAAQLPQLAGSHYDLAAVSVGTNDLLRGLPTAHLAVNLDMILESVAAAADRIVMTTLTVNIGPRANGGQGRVLIKEYNETITAVARRHGALVVDISALNGSRLFRPDRVHPNALGQLQIATLAADLLRHDGVDLREPVEMTLGQPTKRTPVGHLVKYASRAPTTAARNTLKRYLSA